MATNATDIANQALTLLGQGRIGDIDDESDDKAVVCKAHYEPLVELLLSLHTWQFATKKSQLTGTQTPVNEWTYSYAMPADALIRAPDAAFRSTSTHEKPFHDWQMLDGRFHTHEQTVVVDYRYRAPESQWPAHFVQLVTYGMCARVALPITEMVDLANRWYRIAFGDPSEGHMGGYCRTARGIDSKADISDVVDSYGLIEARAGSGYPTQR